jgi:hypothetical protein
LLQEVYIIQPESKMNKVADFFSRGLLVNQVVISYVIGLR